MALIKLDNYILQNAIKRYIFNLEYGKDRMNEYVNKQLANTRLTPWEWFKGENVFSKAFPNGDVAYTMLEQNIIDNLTYTAMFYSGAYLERILDLAAVSASAANSIYVSGWEHSFVMLFADEEYQALLEKKDHVH